jgi:hypothetical protein
MLGFAAQFGWIGIGASVLMAILLSIHVVRTGREMYWLWIILVFQPLGGLIYFLAIVLPQLLGGSTARRIGQTARERLDPEREYRQAKSAVDETPTVHNQMRLAAAAFELERYAEAEALYAQAAQGIHSDDPALLLGRARALVELGRNAEALPLLDQAPETPAATLARARAQEALGDTAGAEKAYEAAAERMPGLEAIARYAGFLARTGRQAQARELLADIDKRVSRTTTHFRAEARRWRDLAAREIG